MASLSLTDAISAVLAAKGVALSFSQEIKKERDLVAPLSSAGFSCKRVRLAHEILPDEEGQVGCVLLLRDGTYRPVLGKGLYARGIQTDESEDSIAADIQQAEEVLIILRNAGGAGKVLTHLRSHKFYLLQIFLCGVLVNLFALTLPLFSSFVYDKVLANGITATMWALVIGLVLVAVVEFSLRAIRIIVAEHVARTSDASIDRSVLHSLLNTRPNALPDMGAVLERYKQLTSYRDFISSTYMLALADLPFLLLFITAVAIISGPLVLVGITCGMLVVGVNAFLIRPAFDYEKKSRRASEKRLGLLADIITARDAMLGSYAENAVSYKWYTASNAASYASSMARLWFGIGQSTTNTLSFLSYAGVLVGGAYMVEANTLTSGGLLATSMLTARMIGTFSSVTTLFVRYHELRNALTELNKILPSTDNPSQSEHVHGPLQGAVRLDRVTCNVGHGGHPVLKDISLAIAQGEMVGIAGAPGSGKTTLMRLIAGLILPDEGQVLMDDIPVSQLSSGDIARAVGYKPQDICLLEGSIEENIRAGHPAFSSDARRRVLDFTGLVRDFQENGLNWTTQVGQRGSNLSGGQRQLVALARAIAYEPRLLLLDEPTNGMDAPLEEHLARQLGQIRGKATIIISTHSRHLLSVCDRIVVVGKSKILADGPRDRVLVKSVA